MQPTIIEKFRSTKARRELLKELPRLIKYYEFTHWAISNAHGGSMFFIGCKELKRRALQRVASKG